MSVTDDKVNEMELAIANAEIVRIGASAVIRDIGNVPFPQQFRTGMVGRTPQDLDDIELNLNTTLITLIQAKITIGRQIDWLTVTGHTDIKIYEDLTSSSKALSELEHKIREMLSQFKGVRYGGGVE